VMGRNVALAIASALLAIVALEAGVRVAHL
jgi:hypothetical protein